jgi:hypothetical protein
MGILDDKRYEEMDWLSKAVEPLRHPLSDCLASIPDEYELNFAMIHGLLSESYYADVSVSSAIRKIMKSSSAYNPLTYEENTKLVDCFELQVEPGTIVDFTNSTVTGKITLIKTKKVFEDSDLKPLMGMKGCSYYSGHVLRSSADINRLNEIMDVLGPGKDEQKFRSSRSPHKKTVMISNRLNQVIRDNEWNIRDSVLADKVGTWCVQYINQGNLAAMANLCKLKVMTHKGLPIYSMEEV